MSQVNEDLNSLLDDLMALLPANARDQSHAAGIVFILRMIQTLRIGNAAMLLCCFHGNLPFEGLRLLARKTQRVCNSCTGN